MSDVVRTGIWDWCGWSNEDVKDEIRKILGMGKQETFLQREMSDNVHRNDTWVRPEATHWDTLWSAIAVKHVNQSWKGGQKV